MAGAVDPDLLMSCKCRASRAEFLAMLTPNPHEVSAQGAGADAAGARSRRRRLSRLRLARELDGVLVFPLAPQAPETTNGGLTPKSLSPFVNAGRLRAWDARWLVRGASDHVSPPG